MIHIHCALTMGEDKTDFSVLPTNFLLQQWRPELRVRGICPSVLFRSAIKFVAPQTDLSNIKMLMFLISVSGYARAI